MIDESRRDMEPAAGPGAAPLRGLGEADCVLLARNGNRAAQAELVHRHMPIVYNLSLKLLCRREDAADATQEVFVRALSAIEAFDPKRSFRAWICAITWNWARDELRKRKRRRLSAVDAAAARGPREGGEAFEPVDRRTDSPVEALEKKERSQLLEKALSRLEPRARALLLLREVEGLSYEEIAEIDGCGLGTVKSRLHRARMELKDAFKHLQPEWFRS